MKIPSLFKIPKYSRFQFSPRYYDPVKEEIEQRTARIAKEIKVDSNSQIKYGYGISGAFARHDRQQAQSKTETGRLVIIITVLAGFFAYIWYGDWVLYPLAAIVAIYFVLRFKKIL